MKIRLDTAPLEKHQKSSLIIGIFENGELTPAAEKLDHIGQGWIKKLLKQGAFQGKIDQCLPVFYPAHTSFDYVLLVGCGQAAKLNMTSVHKIIMHAMKTLQVYTGHSSVICYLSELYQYGHLQNKNLPSLIKYLTESMHTAQYRFDLFKTKKEKSSVIKQISIHLPDIKQEKNCEKAIQEADATAFGMTLAKNLANLPSNLCTPAYLAKEAKKLGQSYSQLSVSVLEEAAMKKLGMGALLAVSQGSREPAKLICLQYTGGKNTKKSRPIVLIGKGVTFDTGGNSLKPADAMVGMKYDMCGAATVLGVMKGLAELKLPLHVVGIIPAVENMPGGQAYKPEDILTSLSGQTIEVISTDAEGRLILADALTYAERYEPEVVIDIATLTGATVIALGHHVSSLLANDDELAKALIQAGEESHDRAWQLPLFEEYQEQINSRFADMANTGGRSAGVITAACFLSRFAKFSWAHLDVAGTAAMMTGTSERYATGRPVPLLMQYLINRVNQVKK
jgi:leucyl aminopeptidase